MTSLTDALEPTVTSRNTAWTTDELILALKLYLDHPASPPGKDSLQVAELSGFLGRLGQAQGLRDASTFRNVNGVYMKMMNFRRFDPSYTAHGRKGLTRGNKLEEVVWAEFATDPVRLGAVCQAIRMTVDRPDQDYGLGAADDVTIVDAVEGRVMTRIHRVRERSRALVEQAKRAAMKKHGRLACQACDFSFKDKYGATVESLIDVHHTKPVHTLSDDGGVTRLEDLALLCANCHRVVHSSRRWLTVAEVAALVMKYEG